MSSEKQALRQAAREKRRTLCYPGFILAVAACAEDLALAPGTVVGGYHKHRDEADPAQLLARLIELGCYVAFPRVAGKGLPLDYHHVPDGEVLAPGAYGIHEPLSHWPRMTPQVLLTPLLAFDARGNRLGMGGGFYDRTLAERNVPAIGVAYAGQEVASLPHEVHDRRLDAILTENGLRRFP